MQEEPFQSPENSSQPKVQTKTQQRIRYEAQLEVLRRRNGELETIRSRLGFSQKQMCELLLVDPSAWSRWIKPGEDAPAHIYQALDWYLSRGAGAGEKRAAKESKSSDMNLIKAPRLPDLAFMESPKVTSGAKASAAAENNSAISEVTEKLTAWENEKNQLLEKLDKSEKLQAGWKLFLILNSVILVYLIFTRYFSF